MNAPRILDSAPRARRAQKAVPSAVREILKVAESPDVISFAGGLPAPESFPTAEIAAAFAHVLAVDGDKALQYGVTEGFGPLREWIAARLAGRGARVGADDLLITQGSQQGIDLVARVLLDAGDAVLTESPTYVAALQVFAGAEARVVGIACDAEGPDLAALAAAIAAHRPKLFYAMPTFRNPTGSSWSLARREAVLDLVARAGLPVLEDDPYGEIRFAGERLPTLFDIGRAGSVIYLSTFSKTLAPGLRTGFIAAPGTLRRALVIAKQAADLHSPTLTQRAIFELLSEQGGDPPCDPPRPTFDFEAHLTRVRALYASRAEAMHTALRSALPSTTRWERPDGGLFFWVELPRHIQVAALLECAIARKVAFVPGAAFFVDRPDAPFVRLNFSHRPEPVIREGVARLAAALREVEGAPVAAPPGRYQ